MLTVDTASMATIVNGLAHCFRGYGLTVQTNLQCIMPLPEYRTRVIDLMPDSLTGLFTEGLLSSSCAAWVLCTTSGSVQAAGTVQQSNGSVHVFLRDTFGCWLYDTTTGSPHTRELTVKDLGALHALVCPLCPSRHIMSTPRSSLSAAR
jgi:hypothetical protein